MRIENQLSSALIIADLLADSQSQYQSGIKQLTLAPNGDANGSDIKDIPNTMAGESVTLQTLLADGSVKIISEAQSLGGNAVPGVLLGAGVGMAFAGTIRTRRDDGGSVFVHRIMFGTPVAGDEVVDLVIAGYNVPVAAAGQLFISVSADAASPIDATISGTVAAVVANAAASDNVMVTFTGTAGTGADASLAQAGYTIFAGLA